MSTPIVVRSSAFRVASGEDTDTGTESFDATGCDFLVVDVMVGYPGPDVTSATFDGTSMTSIGDSGAAPDDQARVISYGLEAPSSGTRDVVVVIDDSTDRWGYLVRGFSGVDQTTPTGTAATHNTGGASTDSATVTAAVGDLVISAVMFPHGSGGNSIAVTGGATQDIIDSSGTTGFQPDMGGSSVTAASTSVVMSWSGNTEGLDSAIIGVALKGASDSSTVAAVSQSLEVGIEIGNLSGAA